MAHKSNYRSPAGKKVPKAMRGTKAGHKMAEKQMQRNMKRMAK